MRLHRRHVLAALAAGLCTPGAVLAEPQEPRWIREDYAAARRGFETRLLRRGPAPGDAPPLEAPPGVRAISYRSDGLDLVAWVSQTGDPARLRPGILVLHGGNALWPGHWDIARPFAEAGFVALMPAVRAENGLPGAFSGFYDETADVVAAAETLRALPGVDPARLFVAGHSVGGTLTLLAALASPLFRGAASFSGNPDAAAFFRHFTEDLRFDPGRPAEFEMRSAACFAANFRCPVLMLRAGTETRSDAANRLTVSRAASAGLRVERGVIEGDHSSALPGEIVESLRFFAAL
ncbi:alpha/beta hydrolase family protein [Aureimonas pseudogalii]|uniref:Dipeptidyl aminopeptidase/acylaminoacyl peptidase n=1 Tax=Aureimonas pseudogalii TaxID=1744844 RepID=A0A7W6H7G1_9HYPH|nr:prolyl oligopeptidase family serine peptidase [Aureimonas pseudogalii]MBB3999966.1 dipeptidyl aminopeptidase/acylaminoacyl peptidase [Aureimonas pseudogalii]